MYCKQCDGKVVVDTTFTENKAYELNCLRCGKRVFVSSDNPLFPYIKEYLDRKKNT